MTKKYQVLSPDNLPISPNFYSSIKKAKVALSAWTQNFNTQGYYSQTCYNGYVRQIPINLITDYCEIVLL